MSQAPSINPTHRKGEVEPAALSLVRVLTEMQSPGVPADAELGLHVYAVEQSVAALEEVSRVERLCPEDVRALRTAASEILLIILRNDAHV